MSIPFIDRMNHPAVLKISSRLRRYNIQIGNYVAGLDGEPWTDNPTGFNFFCTNPANFKQALLSGYYFGIAWQSFDQQKNCSVLREVSQPSSLHIILSDLPNRQS